MYLLFPHLNIIDRRISPCAVVWIIALRSHNFIQRIKEVFTRMMNDHHAFHFHLTSFFKRRDKEFPRAVEIKTKRYKAEVYKWWVGRE